MTYAPNRESRADLERELLYRAVARLRASVMALTFGLVGAAALFVATAWLLVKGGPDVGQHLRLLGIYLPGYSVSWPGAAIGALWGAALGAAIGGTLAWVYNRIAFRAGTRRGR